MFGALFATWLTMRHGLEHLEPAIIATGWHLLVNGRLVAHLHSLASTGVIELVDAKAAILLSRSWHRHLVAARLESLKSATVAANWHRLMHPRHVVTFYMIATTVLLELVRTFRAIQVNA
jgi:hypothetical protein